MPPKAKKQRIVYKDDPAAKAAELEALLFAPKDPTAIFEQGDEDDDTLTVADLVHKAAAGDADAPLFFIDKAGQDDVELKSSDTDTQGSEGSEDNEHQGSGNDDAAEIESSISSEHEAVDDRTGMRQQGPTPSTSGRGPVWSDPADAKLQVDVASQSRLRKLRSHEGQKVMNGSQYQAALRKQHALINPRTMWASRDKRSKLQRAAAGDQSDGEQETGAEVAELLLQAGGLLATRSNRLPPGTLEATRVKDANMHEPNNAVVRSIEFHPTGQLFMTAGMDKKLRLFQVDGLRNPKVQSVFLEDCPIQKAAFASGGSQIVASGRRPHFYVHDLESGHIERVLGPTGCKLKSLESFAVSPSASEPLLAFHGDQGYVPLVSLKTRQWISNLKMNSSVRAASFSPDGTELITAGSDGILYIWDIRTCRCVQQLVDYGNVNATSLAVSQNNRYLATGGVSGVVNVYQRDHSLLSTRGAGPQRSTPTPLREIMNLTTTADNIVFSPDSQIMAISSRMQKDALRLVHVPSFTVFSNWPTSRSPLHYVHSLAFSPKGGFLAVGNAKGHVLLYRLHHYAEA